MTPPTQVKRAAVVVQIAAETTDISGFVVSVTVLEHESPVVDALLSGGVHVLLKLPLDDAHIHGLLDDSEIVLRGKREGGREATSKMTRIIRVVFPSSTIHNPHPASTQPWLPHRMKHGPQCSEHEVLPHRSRGQESRGYITSALPVWITRLGLGFLFIFQTGF